MRQRVRLASCRFVRVELDRLDIGRLDVDALLQVLAHSLEQIHEALCSCVDDASFTQLG
jgi:hypothetical protein